MQRSFNALLVVLACAGPVLAQAGEGVRTRNPEIDARDCRIHVSYLASDELQGRRPGTDGCRAAARYIEKELRTLGLEPAVGSSFLHEFEVKSGCRLSGTNVLTLGTTTATGREGRMPALGTEWTPMPFSASVDAPVSGEVVFAGYGVTTPDGKWDDYESIDAKGKVVVVFMKGAPDLGSDPHDPHGSAGLYEGPRYKVFNASRHGAAAVILVGDSRQRGAEKLIDLAHEVMASQERIPVVQAKRGAVTETLARHGLDLLAAEKTIRGGQRASKAVAGLSVDVQTGVEAVVARTANVAALLPGTDPAVQDEIIVIGGHYDHLGLGGPGSLAPNAGRGHIHNGADDNASGIAGILELAEYFKAHRLRRPLLVLAFSAEEMGLLGSQAWASEKVVTPERCRAMFNFDMIGRLGSEGLIVDGVGTMPAWREVITSANTPALKLSMSSGAEGGRSDHAPFIQAGIPAVHFFTGAHEDYHRPSDDTEKVNFEGMVDVLTVARHAIAAVDRDDIVTTFVKPEKKKAAVSGRGYGAWLGTIPSYTQESGGVLLQGASAGSPAAKAGVQKGDVLVGMGDIEIDNIYDFTNALRSFRPGETVELRVKRGGKVSKLTATLARR